MKDSWNRKERRRHPRIQVEYLALCTHSEYGIFQKKIAVGRVLDMSPGGVKMEMDSAVRVGSDIRMQIAIQDFVLQAEGRVIYASPQADERRVLGVAYAEPIKDLCVDV